MLQKKLIEKRMKIIAGFIKSFDKVLDIGCADCVLKNYIENGEYVGVDLNPSNNDIFKVDVSNENLSFDNNFFDVVVMSEILEHLLNPFFAVGEAFRVLKHGGLLVVTVPNVESVNNVLMGMTKNLGGRKIVKGGHVMSWDMDSGSNFFLNAGFEVIKLDKVVNSIKSWFLPEWWPFKGFATYSLFVLRKPL